MSPSKRPPPTRSSGLKAIEQRQLDPIRSAVRAWLASSPPEAPLDHAATEHLLAQAPKRFVIYEPMAQLPAGSFTQPVWTTFLDRQPEQHRTRLWVMILDALSKRAGSKLTHLSATAGIPLHREGENEGEANHGREDNVLRSPSGLRMLHGDFGPVSDNLENFNVARQEVHSPSPSDFDRTLWVSTKQNRIRQIWAPRWTMFSRGNVKEKARLLAFPAASSLSGVSPEPSTSATAVHGDIWAVDLYAGIGYFVFSYASLGMRVLCWEINPWSIEGLRRGALANGWTVRVLQSNKEEGMMGMEDLPALLAPGGPQIVVLAEDNQNATARIRDLRRENGLALDVQHVNCGFLPTSEPTWRTAWDLTAASSSGDHAAAAGSTDGGSWLHLHENVQEQDIESRQRAIQKNWFGAWSTEGGEKSGRRAQVKHVERVKTFAPGVWHCVFDVHVTSTC